MTNREFLTTITTIENAPAEIKEYAEAALAKMDATNEARKAKPSKTAQANAPIMDQIVNEVLSDEALTAATVAEAIGVSVQKANALLRALVAEGRAEVTEVKVPKKGAQKAYTKAAPTQE